MPGNQRHPSATTLHTVRSCVRTSPGAWSANGAQLTRREMKRVRIRIATADGPPSATAAASRGERNAEGGVGRVGMGGVRWVGGKGGGARAGRCGAGSWRLVVALERARWVSTRESCRHSIAHTRRALVTVCQAERRDRGDTDRRQTETRRNRHERERRAVACGVRVAVAAPSAPSLKHGGRAFSVGSTRTFRASSVGWSQNLRPRKRGERKSATRGTRRPLASVDSAHVSRAVSTQS